MRSRLRAHQATGNLRCFFVRFELLKATHIELPSRKHTAPAPGTDHFLFLFTAPAKIFVDDLQ